MTGVKRYNLGLPAELYNELHEISKKEHSTVLEMIRKFIKLGLVIIKIGSDPNSAVIIRDAQGERELKVII